MNTRALKDLVAALTRHENPFHRYDYQSFTDQLKTKGIEWTDDLDDTCIDVLLFRTFGNAFKVGASEERFAESGLLNEAASKSSERFQHTPAQIFTQTLDTNPAFIRESSAPRNSPNGLRWWRYRQTGIHLTYDVPPGIEGVAYPSLSIPVFEAPADLGLLLPDLVIDTRYSAARFPGALAALEQFCDGVSALLSD